MSILDELKDKIRGFRGADEYDDYDEYYDENAPEAQAQPREQTSGVLGNTRRPEAESVNVFTRSGKPLGSPTRAYPDTQYPATSEYAPAPVRTPSSYNYARADETTQMNFSQPPAPEHEFSRPQRTQASSQLPAYVLKPASYDDVQMVVRRVRTHQPVILVLKNTNVEAAKRILDFCLGLTCGIGGRVDEFGDRVFVVLPEGTDIAQAEVDKLLGASAHIR